MQNGGYNWIFLVKGPKFYHAIFVIGVFYTVRTKSLRIVRIVKLLCIIKLPKKFGILSKNVSLLN